MNFDTLIFDMDGVIIDSEVLFDNADTEFFRRHGKIYNREEVALLLTGMHLKAGTALIKEKYNLLGDVEDLVNERQGLLEAEYKLHLKYMTGFEDFFEKVKSAGLKTCIATSCNDYLLNLVNEKLALNKKFGANIFKASDVGNVSKPDPAIYLYAAKKIDSEPSKCVVIEDAPKGVQAAKNAGMYCIGITTTFAADRLLAADLVVDSFQEIDLSSVANTLRV